MFMRSLAMLALAVSPALAQAPMSAEAFERYSTGKTLFFSSGGLAYGAEQYLPGRRVIWTFLDGECQDGFWYEEAGLICFEYEGKPGSPQCWSFFESGTGLIARFEDDPGGTTLFEAEQSTEPLACPGPEVGV